MTETKNKSRLYLTTFLLLLLTVVLGRLVSYFTSVTATDIAYSDWVPSLLGWLGEILSAARTVIGFSSVAAAGFCLNRSAALTTAAIASAAAFIDCLARFLIDILSSSLTGMELLAVIWLLLQFVYEVIFIALAYIIAGIIKGRYDRAESARAREKNSSSAALRFSLILVMLSKAVLEICYLVDFLMNYSNITSAETASIIGQFIRIAVIYGGLSIAMGELIHPVHTSILTGGQDEEANT